MYQYIQKKKVSEEMKKLLIIGASILQLPAIKKAKELGIMLELLTIIQKPSAYLLLMNILT